MAARFPRWTSSLHIPSSSPFTRARGFFFSSFATHIAPCNTPSACLLNICERLQSQRMHLQSSTLSIGLIRQKNFYAGFNFTPPKLVQVLRSCSQERKWITVAAKLLNLCSAIHLKAWNSTRTHNSFTRRRLLLFLVPMIYLQVDTLILF